jgi:hypothetical protein
VIFLTLTVFTASLSRDKFFAELSPQNWVDSMICALEIFDRTRCAEELSTLIPRSQTARTPLGFGHCTNISLISSAGSYTSGEPSRGFTVPTASRTGGTDTVARE